MFESSFKSILIVDPVLLIRTLSNLIGLGKNVGNPEFIVNGTVLFGMILIGHSWAVGLDLKSLPTDTIFLKS